MKIKEIEIKNFSSIKYLKFNPEDIVALIGRNNSGKSNVLKALQLFFEASTTLVNKESFFNLERNPIEIKITFYKLSDWEKEQFASWFYDEVLIVSRKIYYDADEKIKITNTGYKKIPSVSWLIETKINAANITTWWAVKDTLLVDGLNFGASLGAEKPAVGVWKEKAQSFIEENKTNLTLEYVAEDNPKGYPNVLKGALPEFIYVPSVRDISDEAKVSQSNPFGQLINSILEKLTDEFKIEVKTQLSTINTKLNREGGENRIAEITNVENKLNELMKEVLECDLEIQMPMPELREVFGDAKIYANDGIRTTIESKGQGLQRATIFTILRAYSEISNIKKQVKQMLFKGV